VSAVCSHFIRWRNGKVVFLNRDGSEDWLIAILGIVCRDRSVVCCVLGRSLRLSVCAARAEQSRTSCGGKWYIRIAEL
jgi:hypothetical protein